jgi:VIT1/CCC1 family predicted Fe2+/Mn2+ transporter
LNDALVELTGALAGFTLALRDTTLIAVAGLITGVAASLSMGASEYLSTKTEEGENPLKSSIYTGIAYILTVAFLISPYLIFDNLFICLAIALLNAIIVIFLFTFYISVAKDLSFKARFGEMAGISLTVAAITFVIGFVINHFLGVDA